MEKNYLRDHSIKDETKAWKMTGYKLKQTYIQ